MRPVPWLEAEKYRRPNVIGYESMYGNSFGVFLIPSRGIMLHCLVGDGILERTGLPPEYAWEHVSVSTPKRVPNWYEMCRIKELFWSDEEAVMQLHVPSAQHVNLHPNTLHLWRPRMAEIPLPPLGAV